MHRVDRGADTIGRDPDSCSNATRDAGSLRSLGVIPRSGPQTTNEDGGFSLRRSLLSQAASLPLCILTSFSSASFRTKSGTDTERSPERTTIHRSNPHRDSHLSRHPDPRWTKTRKLTRWLHPNEVWKRYTERSPVRQPRLPRSRRPEKAPPARRQPPLSLSRRFQCEGR